MIAISRFVFVIGLWSSFGTGAKEYQPSGSSGEPIRFSAHGFGFSD
jgi:hypothetical protein